MSSTNSSDRLTLLSYATFNYHIPIPGHRITSLASLVWPVNLDRCFGNTPDASRMDSPSGMGDKTKNVQ